MFDPILPRDNTVADAAQMRSQFNGLKARIDANSTITVGQLDGVTTLPPGRPATVGVSFDGSNVRFTLGIPQGSGGPAGATGEVSITDLNNGLQNNLRQCSNNSNGVSALSHGANGSYNPSQTQDLINKVDELINALRR